MTGMRKEDHLNPPGHPRSARSDRPDTAYWASSSISRKPARIVPRQDGRDRQAAATEVTVLAGGCFWGVQGVFQHVDA